MADARTEKVDTTLTSAELAALDAVAVSHGQSRAGALRLLMLLALPLAKPSPHSALAVGQVRRETELARVTLTLAAEDAAV